MKHTHALSLLTAATLFTICNGPAVAQDPAESAAEKTPDVPPQEVAKKAELPPPLPIELTLFRPDSLAGWTHAADQPTGWSMDQGRLVGQGDSTRLLSGYSFADFELQFAWTAAESATLTLELPRIPHGPAIGVTFGRAGNCGQILDGGKQLAPGKAAQSSDQPRATTIKREGETLTVTVDGQQLSQAKIAADCRFGLGLWAGVGEVSINDMRLHEPLGGPIFNGTDLAGWWCPGRIDAWQAVDGQLVLAGRGGNYLRTEKLYGNFTLSMEFKIRKGGNSGLGIRTARDGWPSGDGMELQILDSPHANKGGMMSIYRNVSTLAVAHKSEDWNQLIVKAEGRMISAWINGQLVQQVNTAWAPELQHRHLKGWIGFQDHGAKLEVRHLRASEAPDGLGLDAWYQPRTETAVRYVLGRLLNSERLSRDDGSRGEIVTCTVEDKGEHVLAEWAGPGALAQVACEKGTGELAFYFDGEEQPRLQCKARDLGGHVPRPTGVRGNSPVLTCLPFQKGLKIVLLDGGPATYHFDVAHLPRGVGVRTYDKATTKMSSSLEAALDYRYHHHSHGVVRQQDPYLRVTSDRKRLDAGAEVDAVQIDGAGLVQWLQLHCPKRCRESDDLWIEITVDGENEPAVVAPVRYFFSGAAVAGRYGNYLLTDRDGPINRLAMPFGNGIRMSLVNRGGEPIDGVALTASIQQPVDDGQSQDFAGRLRLRGVFRAAAEDPADNAWFEHKGRGRLVGLVWDTPPARTSDPTGGQGDDAVSEEDATSKEEEAANAADHSDAEKKSENTNGGGEPDAKDNADDDKGKVEQPAAVTDEPAELTIESLRIDGKPAAGWQPVTAKDFLGQTKQTEDFRDVLSGRQGTFAWRYFLLSPVDFQREITATVPKDANPGNRLALFYTE